MTDKEATKGGRMGVVWKDVRGRNDSEPMWEAELPPLRITVHRYVGDKTGAYVTCHKAGVDKHRMGDMALDDTAKALALREVFGVVQQLWKAVEALKPAVIDLTPALRKKKLENELWSAMDQLLDLLRAVVRIPAECGQKKITLTEKQRLEILRLDKAYYAALMAASPNKRKR